jgi:hypothetical protein
MKTMKWIFLETFCVRLGTLAFHIGEDGGVRVLVDFDAV